jgi:hypothetical protein
VLRDVASPDERRLQYAGLGLSLGYECRIMNGEVKDLFRPSFQAVGGRGVTIRVGGPTRTRGPRPVVVESRQAAYEGVS